MEKNKCVVVAIFSTKHPVLIGDVKGIKRLQCTPFNMDM